MCADRVPGGAAERRRRRRLRMFWRHEQLSLHMMRAAMEHHSRQVKVSVGVQTSVVLEFYAMSEDSDVGGCWVAPTLLVRAAGVTASLAAPWVVRGIVSESRCARVAQA